MTLRWKWKISHWSTGNSRQLIGHHIQKCRNNYPLVGNEKRLSACGASFEHVNLKRTLMGKHVEQAVRPLFLNASVHTRMWNGLFNAPTAQRDIMGKNTHYVYDGVCRLLWNKEKAAHDSQSAPRRNQCPLTARGTIFPIICGLGWVQERRPAQTFVGYLEGKKACEPLNQHTIYWNMVPYSKYTALLFCLWCILERNKASRWHKERERAETTLLRVYTWEWIFASAHSNNFRMYIIRLPWRQMDSNLYEIKKYTLHHFN